MPTLHKYFHVIVFVIFLILFAFLQVGPFGKGWPLPLGIEISKVELFHVLLRLFINLVPGVIVLSLCMIPFGYDTERTLSIRSLLLLTLAAGLNFLILTPGYLDSYRPGEQLSIFVLTTMALNGLLFRIKYLLVDNVQLPQWRKPGRVDRELDKL